MCWQWFQAASCVHVYITNQWTVGLIIADNWYLYNLLLFTLQTESILYTLCQPCSWRDVVRSEDRLLGWERCKMAGRISGPVRLLILIQTVWSWSSLNAKSQRMSAYHRTSVMTPGWWKISPWGRGLASIEYAENSVVATSHKLKWAYMHWQKVSFVFWTFNFFIKRLFSVCCCSIVRVLIYCWR